MFQINVNVCVTTSNMLVFWSACHSCLSVKLQWIIQFTREIQGGNSWIQEFWVCAVSTTLMTQLKSQFVSLRQSYANILNLA